MNMLQYMSSGCSIYFDHPACRDCSFTLCSFFTAEVSCCASTHYCCSAHPAMHCRTHHQQGMGSAHQWVSGAFKSM